MAQRIDGNEKPLAACRVLVVEDQFLIAEDLRTFVDSLGATVIGPASSVRAALELLATHRPDVALLDVNLGSERVYPVAEALQSSNIPFVFMTGYEPDALDERFRSSPCIEKPVDAAIIAETLARIPACMHA